MAISYNIKRKFALAVLAVLMSVMAQAQILMTGTVMNDKGVNMIGAYIAVDSTNIATLTDLNGSFSLSVPTKYAGRKVLVSYAGYMVETLEVSPGNHTIELHSRESQAINEMQVSTQNRLQSLVEVPIAVSAIDSAKMRQNAIYNMDDIARFVPGFTSNSPSGQINFYSIRGVASDEPYSYGQSRISVFMDDVPITRMQTSNLDHYDMQRVEISRGPQGTLLGRGAEIGAVHFHRKKPTDEFGADISVLYGNYNKRKAVGVLNTPAGQMFSNRLAFLYHANDGFIENNAGGRLNGKNTIAARNSSVFHFGSSTDLHFVFDFQKDDSPSSAYQCKTQYNNIGEVTTTDKSPFTSANLTLGDGDLYMKRKTGGALMKLESKFSENVQFSSISGFRAYDSEESFDADGTQLPILHGLEGAKGMQVSQELRLNWETQKRKLKGFVGASYFYEKGEHYYKFNANLRYIFPLALGKSMQSSLASLPEEIISGVEKIITAWAQGTKEVFKPYENVERNGVKVGDIMDEIITNFATTVTNSIRSQVANQFGKWFDVIYWEKTPDFFNDAKNIITNTIKDEINQLLANDTYLVADIFQELGMTGESIVESIDFESGLMKLKPTSNIALSDTYYEEEIDYNRSHEASAFADFTWNFVGKFYLTLGIRGIYETVKTGYYSESMAAPILGSIIYTNTDGVTVWTTPNEYKSWVGRAVVNWMFNPTHNVYISASKGRRPGMVYYDYHPEKIVSLAPEITYSYEAGIKGHTKYGHLSYALAFYYFDWKHFQTMLAGLGTSESGTLTYVYDDNGLAYGAGTELTGTYTFNPNVSIYSDFAYCGGTFADKDMNGNVQNNSGNQFAMTPRYMYDLGLNWKHLLPNGKTIYFYPSLYAQSKMYFDEINNPAFMQRSYLIANANAGVQWTRGRITFDVGLYGQNITNTKYIVEAGSIGEVIGMPTYVAGQPATVYLSYRMHIK